MSVDKIRKRTKWRRKPRQIRMVKKNIRGKVEVNYGADNFCYIWSKNGRRVDLTEWMKRFNGKDVELYVLEVENEKL